MGMNGSSYEEQQLKVFGKPRWNHECDKCKFLGTFGEEDVYLCGTHREESAVGPTLLRRYGNEPSEYSSGDIGYSVPGRSWDVTTQNLMEELYRREFIKFKVEVSVERINNVIAIRKGR